MNASFGAPYGQAATAIFRVGEQAVVERTDDGDDGFETRARKHQHGRISGHAALAAELLRACFKGIPSAYVPGYQQNGEKIVRFLDFPSKEPLLFDACCHLVGIDADQARQRFETARNAEK